VKKKELLHIGTFNKPLGLKGEIKIVMHTNNFESFKSLSPFLDFKGNNIWNFSYLKINNGKLIGKLKDYNNRSYVENLKGKKIYTYKINLPKTKINQHYVIDLIGCKVVNKNNIILGKNS